MLLRMRQKTGLLISILGFFCAGNDDLLAWEVPATGLKRSSLQRLEMERLRQTNQDVAKLQKFRRELALPPGQQDFRTIFHAHADDSDHTGGTLPELIREAKTSGIRAIFLSDHYRPPRDFFSEQRSGLVDGVLLIPGSEWAGFLIHPTRSVMDKMKSPASELLEAVRAEGGFAYLSHVEERTDHSMEQLDGQEIYNRHYDAIADRKGFLQLFLALTSPTSLQEFQEKVRLYPDETFAFQSEYPKLYLKKFDTELLKKRLTGVAANDCHHNMVMIIKKNDENSVLIGTIVDRDDQMRKITVSQSPSLKVMLEGKPSGEILGRIDLDPYHRSFANSSTHLFARDLTDRSLREALSRGRAYVSHDWICNPTGFWVDVRDEKSQHLGMIGDEFSIRETGKLHFHVQIPAKGWIRLIRNGHLLSEIQNVADADFEVTEPGIYRVEVFQVLDGEARGWIYANPIYVRP